MKKLFTIKDEGSLRVEKEGAVYSIFSYSSNQHIFFDSEGKMIENYSCPPIQDDEDPAEINDPDFLEEIGEGFYLYTTHKVTYDVDGKYGLFGIKYNSGEKLTDEKYYQVGGFCNGLCSVRIKDGEWGCINTDGDLVIPYNFYEEMFFNEYGVAVGNRTLIDKFGNEIPGTALNCIGNCGELDRYFTFSFLNDKQLASIAECGTAPDVTIDVYDTKNRAYVIKGIPENRLEVYSFDGEPDVILAAAKWMDEYERIYLSGKGTILCEKDGLITVYDYYQ